MSREIDKEHSVGILTVFTDGTFMLKNVPTWYAQFAHPKPFEEGAAEKYSLTAFLDKTEHKREIKMLEELIRENMAEGCDWDDVVAKNRCLLDGKKIKNVDEDSPLVKMFRVRFSANANFPPAIRNASGEKLNRRIPEEMEEIEKLNSNGRIATILSNFYGWKHKSYGEGMTLNLLAIKLSNKFTDLKLGASAANDGDDLDWGDDEDDDGDDF